MKFLLDYDKILIVEKYSSQGDSLPAFENRLAGAYLGYKGGIEYGKTVKYWSFGR